MLERTVGALQQENRLAKKAIFDLQTETGWLLRELDAKADEEHTRFLNFRVAHTISLGKSCYSSCVSWPDFGRLPQLFTEGTLTC